jgi:stage V sporulation protein SpoVS
MANGIPALLGKVANVTNTASLLVSDVKSVLGMFAGPKWGVFNLDGSVALQPDSIISLDFKRELLVPNYSMEQGAFQSYNKVATPSDTNVRMTKGGSDSVREAFLIAVSTLVKSLTLVNIAMPEGAVIQSVNAVRFDFRRTATNGVGLITVDVAFQEIRVTATTTFSNTAQPSGADPQNGGSVQAQSPTVGAATLFGPNSVSFQ